MAGQQKYFATVPPQEILPVTNSRFESSVRGIFVIGDVTGLPLVKVAANQGAEVVEKMAQAGLFTQQAGTDEERLDAVIVGGGPAGLSAAVELQKRGVKYVLLERDHVASTIRSFPPGKKVYSEPRFLKNVSAMDVEGDREKAEFLQMVQDTLGQHGIQYKEKTEVARVVKQGERKFDVETTDGKHFPARSVIVAVGRQGQPRTLDVPGAEMAHKVTYRFHTAEDYHDKDVAVVGGGNSAIEAALMLKGHNRVTLVYRGEDFFRAKEDNRQQLEAAERDGTLTVLRRTNVTAIREEEVDLDVGGAQEARKNDHVIVQIGALPPVDFLMDMGLELDGIWTKRRVAWSILGVLFGIFLYYGTVHFDFLPTDASGVIHVPGFSWLFRVIPDLFSRWSNFYGLLYFSLIGVFGLYWAIRYNNKIVWRRNLLNIFFNWTLWWGIPTFLVVLIGRNAWSPVIAKSLNAWPLNYAAFTVSPDVRPGDPGWWYVVGIVGVVWAVVLTFIVLPVFTLLVGKHYCSHMCSCGALAETVGNSFRHRGPKTDTARWAERFGFAFIPLCAIATIASFLGYAGPLNAYSNIVGTFLAGALAIGLYPFLGNRMWCRYWCPLAFWMNFWGRWSRFKISPEKGKCIDCNVCNQYCQMGIDIKTRALQGVPVTLKDTPCVACGECIARCPMEILHFGDAPARKEPIGGQHQVAASLHSTLDIPRFNEMCIEDRNRKEQ